MDEFLLAMKMYSLAGEMLIKHSQFKLGCLMFTKLLNACYTAKVQPCEYKLFALKQMAFCYLKNKEYGLALKTLKKKLQLAWVVDSCTAETACYEMMSTCYYYKGNLKKSAYYNERYLRGVTEADFSRVRKINVLQSKDLSYYLKNPPKDFKPVKSLFSAMLKDYSLVKPEIIEHIKEINRVTMDERLFAT